MKVTAKIIKVGNSRAVIMPTLWFKLVEDELGTVYEVEMEDGCARKARNQTVSRATAPAGSRSAETPAGRAHVQEPESRANTMSYFRGPDHKSLSSRDSSL